MKRLIHAFPSREILILLFGALLIKVESVHAQSELFHVSLEEKMVEARVKLLGQFMGRFNYQEDFAGNRVLNPDDSKMRTEMLVSLFAKETVEKADEAQLLNFISDVVESKQNLTLRDDHWYAKARCVASLGNQDIVVDLMLKTYVGPENTVEWVIAGAYSEAFKLQPNTSEAHISANANELNFLRLGEDLAQRESQLSIFDPNFSPSYLSLFLYFIQNQQLQIKYVEELTYHFFQIPGWIMSVSEFNRLDMNSGWLISEVRKADLNTKNWVLLHELHLSYEAFFESGARPKFIMISSQPTKENGLVDFYLQNEILGNENERLFKQTAVKYITGIQELLLNDRTDNTFLQIIDLFGSPYTRVANIIDDPTCSEPMEIREFLSRLLKEKNELAAQVSFQFNEHQVLPVIQKDGKFYGVVEIETSLKYPGQEEVFLTQNIYVDLQTLLIDGIF